MVVVVVCVWGEGEGGNPRQDGVGGWVGGCELDCIHYCYHGVLQMSREWRFCYLGGG
jgi:hypothetical protein